MTLGEYIEQHGSAAKRAIAVAAGIRWATVHDIARGVSVPRAGTARRIEQATGGAVTAAELLGLVDHHADAAE